MDGIIRPRSRCVPARPPRPACGRMQTPLWHSRWWTWLIILVTSASNTMAAAPAVTRMVPAGAQIGQTQAITLTGTLPEDTQIWCADSTLKIQLNAKEKQLQIEVPSDAPPGPRWLRFYNAEGVTNPLPVVLTRLAQSAETEPNNELEQATQCEPETVITGVLEKSGDVDTFRIEPPAGKTLVVELDAARTHGSPLDGILQIVDANGFILAQNDDTIANDPRIAFPVDRPRPLFVRVFGFPATPNSTIGFAGGATYLYRLTLTSGPFVTTALPPAALADQTGGFAVSGWNLPAGTDGIESVRLPDGTRVVTQPGWSNFLRVDDFPFPDREIQTRQGSDRLSVPSAVAGVLASGEKQHEFTIELKKGTTTVFDCYAQRLDSQLDPLLEFTSPSGKLLATSDDISRSNRDSRQSLKAAEDGAYRVSIRDRFGNSGQDYVYLLAVGDHPPSFDLTVENSTWSGTAGKPLEIKVSLNRLGGFKQPLVVRAEGLPEGAKSEPLKLDEKAKDGTLKISSDSAITGGFRIVGHPEGNEAATVAAHANLPGHRQQTSLLWISVAAGSK